MDKLFGYVFYPSLAIFGVINIVLFYKPIFNWSTKPSEATFISDAPIIANFLFTVFIIIMLTALFAFGLIALAYWLFQLVKNPPKARGLETYYEKELNFTFRNETIADEFLTLNQDLGAHV